MQEVQNGEIWSDYVAARELIRADLVAASANAAGWLAANLQREYGESPPPHLDVRGTSGTPELNPAPCFPASWRHSRADAVQLPQHGS